MAEKAFRKSERNLGGGGKPPKPRDPKKRLRSKLRLSSWGLGDKRGRSRVGEVMKEL